MLLEYLATKECWKGSPLGVNSLSGKVGNQIFKGFSIQRDRSDITIDRKFNKYNIIAFELGFDFGWTNGSMMGDPGCMMLAIAQRRFDKREMY
jgi:hypothetical protein